MSLIMESKKFKIKAPVPGEEQMYTKSILPFFLLVPSLHAPCFWLLSTAALKG